MLDLLDLSTLNLVLVRLPVSTVLVSAGFLKLVRFSNSATIAWRPASVAVKYWIVLVAIASSFELMIGVAFLFGSAMVDFATMLFVIVGSIYGLISISRTGSCGCTGDGHETSGTRYVLSNAILILAIAGARAIDTYVGTGAAPNYLEASAFLLALTLFMAIVAFLRGIVRSKQSSSSPLRSPSRLS